VVFDGDCNFCRRWISSWRQMTEGRVDFAPSQQADIAAKFPEIPAEAYANSIQLIETNGRVYSGSEAVFRMLRYAPGEGGYFWCYQHLPGFKFISESFYAFVARHRIAFSRLTRWLLPPEPSEFFRVRNVFLRFLGVVYLFAFGSFWMQAGGLIGGHGILPVSQYMREAAQYFRGFEGWHQLPTFCWWSASDASLQWQCGIGVAASVALILGIIPALFLPLLWLLYLSLTVAGQDFMSFQWENLLLEAGFLAIFLAPIARTLRSRQRSSFIAVVLLRWLLFRLMFESGVVKLLSGDPTWRNFTALTYHYETQPLPTVIGWWAHQLPAWFHMGTVALIFVIELGVSFFILAPRRFRLWTFYPLVALQLGIALTGNYCYFNFLTIALCFLLLDDAALPKWFNSKPTNLPDFSLPGRFGRLALRLRGLLLTVCAVVVLLLSCLELCSIAGWTVPRALSRVHTWFAPFRSVNQYGLFAVMTTSRPEIIVEGSADGTNWLAYEFKYKPGNLKRAPRWIEPLQPRLDWQMWFAALSNYQQNPWFLNFCLCLLQGRPEVLGLIEKNPFPDAPPKYIRARTYDYEFTTPARHRESGEWWRREYLGEYMPPVSLNRE
jgi:predicted DCC family thiol-disulfide oxidoreductase YuxK